MKFPCWSDYDSVYDGVELEIHIVDHCNLNCAGCNHFCSLAEPFYISLKDFQEQLELTKIKIPSLKWLMLLGGEPTLHPQLLELCQIARKIFPNIIIEVLTNGKDLSQVIIHKNEFEELNIRFTIARYNISYNEKNLAIVANMKNSGFSWGRESFTQTLVDITGSQDMNKSFYETCHHQLPCFTLQDYKIFECPFAAHIRHFNKKFHTNIQLIENIDYLNLKTLDLDKLEKFAYQPKNICRYCKPGENWIWHLSDGSFNEYTKTMIELYFSDYKKYEYIKMLKSNSMKSDILESVDPNFGLDISQENKIRFNGKIDIIIPYYILSIKEIQRLFQTLNQQSIIQDCMIYLISDNSPNEKAVINIAQDFKNLNIIFLKNEIRSGPGAARNKGIKYSSNKYIFFLDSDDYLFDPLSLEKIYNIISASNYDIITINRQLENHIKLNQVDYLCKKDFLIKNNIYFGNYFIHEDLFFAYQLQLNHARICKSEYNGVIYNQNNNFNISSMVNTNEVVLNKYFTLYKICQLILTNKDIDISYIELYLNDFAEINNIEQDIQKKITDNPELIENIYYILFRSIQLVKDQVNYNNLHPLLKSLLQNSFEIYGSEITNVKELIKKVNQNFKKYSNNIYLKQIIVELKGEQYEF